MRIEIYKKQLNKIKAGNSKSDKWNNIFPIIGKKVFSENIPELMKYKIMIWLFSFEYLIEDNGVHVFEIQTWPNEYRKYIDYYNNTTMELKNIKIMFVLNH